jgi:DNA-binding transcriptional LysR family regulator
MRPYFEAMQATMDAARQRAEAFMRLDDTPLRVGIMCTIGPGRLIGLVHDFISGHPGVELLLRDGPVAMLETALENGEIDVAIASRATPTPYALASVPLYSEGFLIAVGPGHPLARLNEVHLRDLCGHRYLARSNCEYDTVIDRICSAAGVDLAVAYESERDDWVQSMVMAGLGMTLIPEYSVSVPGLVTRRVADLPVRRRIELQTVRGRPHGPAVGAFVGACRSHRWDEPRTSAPGRRPDVAA